MLLCCIVYPFRVIWASDYFWNRGQHSCHQEIWNRFGCSGGISPRCRYVDMIHDLTATQMCDRQAWCTVPVTACLVWFSQCLFLLLLLLATRPLLRRLAVQRWPRWRPAVGSRVISCRWTWPSQRASWWPCTWAETSLVPARPRKPGAARANGC